MKWNLKNWNPDPLKSVYVIMVICIVFFSGIYFREKYYLSQSEKLRYSIAKMTSYKKSNFGYTFFGEFFHHGTQYNTNYDGDAFYKKLRPGFVLGRYYWVVFNSEKPKFNEVVKDEYIQSFPDSIPIPKEGLTEEEFLKVYESMKNDSTTYRAIRPV